MIPLFRWPVRADISFLLLHEATRILHGAWVSDRIGVACLQVLFLKDGHPYLSLFGYALMITMEYIFPAIQFTYL